MLHMSAKSPNLTKDFLQSSTLSLLRCAIPAVHSHTTEPASATDSGYFNLTGCRNRT
jgi:hypothetical protein